MLRQYEIFERLRNPRIGRSLAVHTAQFGQCHPDTIAVANHLAIAFWCAGNVGQAVDLLAQALELVAPGLAPEHAARVEQLCTLGEILLDQDQMERAIGIYHEVLELCVRRSGEHDPSSVAAKGDLAIVLFELGERDEALRLENQAYESARVYLGKGHSVSCVLAWNRVLRDETNGDMKLARSLMGEELAWLLTEDESGLTTDQRIIRSMLAKRLAGTPGLIVDSVNANGSAQASLHRVRPVARALIVTFPDDRHTPSIRESTKRYAIAL